MLQDLQAKYEYLLEESKALWNEFTNGIKPASETLPYQQLVGGHNLNNSKTNPIGNNKAKAFDLANPNNKPAFLNKVNNFNY